MNTFSSIYMWIQSLALIKKILIAGLVVGLILFLQPHSDEAIPQYQTDLVKRGAVTQIVSETGEIMTTGKVDVSSTINGFVDKVFVDNGSMVTRNQPLFTVISSATEEDRAKAYASYLSAKNNLETAQTNKYSIESSMWGAHENFESKSLDTELSVDDPIFIQTQRDWLAAEQKYIDQDKVISQAQAAVSSAWFTYQATIDGTVKAPLAGQIANMSVTTGQLVTGNETALMILSLNETWVVMAVSEVEAVALKPEQSATIKVDALRDSSFEAVVKRVDVIGTESSGVVTYNAYLHILNPSFLIRPGMTVQVDVITQNKEDVLLVQNGAVKPYQGSKAVQILSKTTGQLIYVPVTIGIVGSTHTEIMEGLEDGQEIVVGTISTTKPSSAQGGGVFGGAR